MSFWRCGRCRAQVAPGAPRCPECPSTEFIEAEADEMLKIARDGSVSDSADVQGPYGHPGTGEPVTGTMSPPVSSDDGDVQVAVTVEDAAETDGAAPTEADVAPPSEAPAPSPAVPPRVPPRRAAPPEVPDA